MKLKTKPQEVHVLARKLSKDRWLHDAAAAHALMQAMGEVVASGVQYVNPLVLARADELMREWGFGEDAE